jgi:ACS family hexuronate transporter-like MFS transporter
MSGRATATPAAPAPAAGGALAAGSWPWKVCVFLLTATLLSYLDRQALSVVAPHVASDLSLDNAQLGFLLSAFFWTYALMHIFVGWILDRYNIRITYAFFVALWSLAQIGCGIATSFGGLFAGRLFLGAFETAGQTGAARIIARILPKKDRAFANGIMMSGGSIGAMLAPPVMIWLANHWGWRTGFLILGLAGVLWALSFFVWFRPSRDVLYGPKREGPLDQADQWNFILRNPRFWSCFAGAAFTIPIIHVASAWIPTYFVQQWDMPLAAALSGFLFLIYAGLDVGFIGGGALVRWLSRGGRPVAHARKIVMGISTALMLAAALVPVAASPLMAVGFIFLLNAGRASWGAIFLAFNQDIAPGRVAMIAGVYGCIGSLMGAILVWLIGVITKGATFNVPFLMIGGLAVLGSLPVIVARWED